MRCQLRISCTELRLLFQNGSLGAPVIAKNCWSFLLEVLVRLIWNQSSDYKCIKWYKKDIVVAVETSLQSLAKISEPTFKGVWLNQCFLTEVAFFSIILGFFPLFRLLFPDICFCCCSAFPENFISPVLRSATSLLLTIRMRVLWQASVDFFFPIRSEFAKFLRFWSKKRECQRLKARTCRTEAAWPTDCPVAVWESVFLFSL